MATTSTPFYVLGHSDDELRRLALQNQYWGHATFDMLRRAGIRPGMRVLDVGCGAGDVSLMAAGLVGPTGRVVGIDLSPDAIARATLRAHDAKLANVSFQVGDIDVLALEPMFNAVVGRFVLMYLPDPTATLRRLQHLLRPEGIVAFVEMDLDAARALPKVAFVESVLGYIREVLSRAGIPTALGPQVWRLFLDSGLGEPATEVFWRIEPPPAQALAHLVAETARNLLPMMEKLQVVDADTLGVDSLALRLRSELVTQRATLLPPAIVGTWSRRL